MEIQNFIDVREHPCGKEFTALSFFEIIARNGWLSLIGYIEVPGVTGLCCDENEINSDDAIYNIIKASVNRLFNFDGKYYMSVYRTVMASGDSFRMVEAINRLNKEMLNHSTWKYEGIVEISNRNGLAFKFIDNEDEKTRIIAIILNNADSMLLVLAPDGINQI